MIGVGRVRLTRAAAAWVALTAAGVIACRAPRPERPINATCGAEAFLRVRNFTGRVLEVYELARGQTEFIGFASPGVTQIAVRGPGELSVAYHVREPSEGRDAATVTWLRPDAVGRGQSRVVLELRCR
jgi:hypothetical protein